MQKDLDKVEATSVVELPFELQHENDFWVIRDEKKIAKYQFILDRSIVDDSPIESCNIYCPIDDCTKGKFYPRKGCRGNIYAWEFSCAEHACKGVNWDSHECSGYGISTPVSPPFCNSCHTLDQRSMKEFSLVLFTNDIGQACPSGTIGRVVKFARFLGPPRNQKFDPDNDECIWFFGDNEKRWLTVIIGDKDSIEAHQSCDATSSDGDCFVDICSSDVRTIEQYYDYRNGAVQYRYGGCDYSEMLSVRECDGILVGCRNN